MAKKENRDLIVTLTMGGVLTAIVIVLQLFASAIKFGPFQVSLVLIPIVLGAAMCNQYVSAFLGLVFGAVVLLNGDAAAFLTINPVGTIVTVLVKGAACGFAAGLVYKLAAKVNTYLGVILSAVAAPVINTGIFLIGCRLFFWDTINEWATGAGFENTVSYMFIGLVGANFLFELGINVVLSPVIIRIMKAVKK